NVTGPVMELIGADLGGRGHHTDRRCRLHRSPWSQLWSGSCGGGAMRSYGGLKALYSYGTRWRFLKLCAFFSPAIFFFVRQGLDHVIISGDAAALSRQNYPLIFVGK